MILANLIRDPVAIYALSDPRSGEVRYVGKTSQRIEARMQRHLASVKLESNHRTAWIASLVKIGLEPFAKVLDVVPESLAGAEERRWIARFPNLVNTTPGGEGGPLTELHRKQISKARRGHVVSPETRGKIAEKMRGRRLSQETKERMRVATLGSKHTPETRAKMSESQCRRWDSTKSA